MKDEPKSISIKHMADALNISIGTVDRALHGRHGVSEKTKARVLKMAEQIGYKPKGALPLMSEMKLSPAQQETLMQAALAEAEQGLRNAERLLRRALKLIG